METLVTSWRNGQFVQKGIPIRPIERMKPLEAQALGAKPAFAVEIIIRGKGWDSDIQYGDELEVENGKDAGKRYKVIADPETYTMTQHMGIQAERIVENAHTTK